MLERFLALRDVEEIAVVNEKTPVFVFHARHGWLKTDTVLRSQNKIIELANRIARSTSRRVTLKSPTLNASLAFGRLHCAIPPIALQGPALTIRKFKTEPFTLKQLTLNKMLSSETALFLEQAVLADCNVLFCGNTGSGKTTLLNAVLALAPKRERVVAIEETPEITASNENFVRLVSNRELGIQASDLVYEGLRMRPDKLVLGEARTPQEARALADALLSGQGKSCFATFHAQTAFQAIQRLKTMNVNELDASALDLLVVSRRWTRYANPSSLEEPENLRRIVEIASVNVNEKTGVLELENVFNYNPEQDALVFNKKWRGERLKQKLALSLSRETFSTQQ